MLCWALRRPRRSSSVFFRGDSVRGDSRSKSHFSRKGRARNGAPVGPIVRSWLVGIRVDVVGGVVVIPPRVIPVGRPIPEGVAEAESPAAASPSPATPTPTAVETTATVETAASAVEGAPAGEVGGRYFSATSG